VKLTAFYFSLGSEKMLYGFVFTARQTKKIKDFFVLCFKVFAARQTKKIK